MTALEVLREEYGEESFSEIFKTITADNSSEFERLSELESLGAGIYFTHPYSSRERARNARRNRLFRRYVPKGVPIENYSSEQIMRFPDKMNSSPRRHPGYASLEELFDEFFNQVYSVIKVHTA